MNSRPDGLLPTSCVEVMGSGNLRSFEPLDPDTVLARLVTILPWHASTTFCLFASLARETRCHIERRFSIALSGYGGPDSGVNLPGSYRL
jgi:hypothetical protein